MKILRYLVDPFKGKRLYYTAMVMSIFAYTFALALLMYEGQQITLSVIGYALIKMVISYISIIVAVRTLEWIERKIKGMIKRKAS